MIKRAAVLGLLLLGNLTGLRAFDLQYGALFSVTGIELKNNRPVLPLTRGKYANVRVLDKETFALLKSCAPSCQQKDVDGNTEIKSFRAAKTRTDMWIADVAVDERWLLTFLVFKNKDGYVAVTPDKVKISDTLWLAGVEKLLTLQAQEQGK